MKKILSLFAGLLIFGANAWAQGAPAYSKVRLQFSGTIANGTTVSVVDQNGDAISGASATLTNIQKKDGSNEPVSTTLQTANGHLLTPVYTNAAGNGWILTFQLNGLDSQFEFNEAAVDLHAMNASGGYQNDSNIKYWTANLSVGATEGAMDDFGTSERYGISDPKYQDGSTRHVVATIGGNETVSYADGMVLKLFVKKVEGGGCFCGIKYLDLYKAAPKANVTYHYTLGTSTKDVVVEQTIGEPVEAPAIPFATLDYDNTALVAQDLIVNVDVTENLPFKTGVENAGLLRIHSNQVRYAYIDGEGHGKSLNSLPTEFNNSYFWYITGNLFDGFQLHNLEAGDVKAGDTDVCTGAATTWELRSALAGSQYSTGVFALYLAGRDGDNGYINGQGSNAGIGNLYFWNAADQGSALQLIQDVEVEVSDAKYATLYSKYPVAVPAGVKAYTLALNNETGNLTATETSSFKQATGVVVYAENAGTYSFPVVADAAAVTSCLSGTHTEIAKPAGALVLGLDDEGVVGFYNLEGTTLAAGKAYYVPAASESNLRISFDELTSIISAAQQNGGQAIFDLQGRRVVNAQNGLYIVNGKKVIR